MTGTQIFEIFGWSGAGIVVLLLSLIKVKPLEISVWHFLARKLGKAFNGELFDKVDDMEKTLNTHLAEHEQMKAETNRQRILRFADEMYDHKYHSKESFEDMLAIIEDYDRYCQDHPDFKNKRTGTASKVINDQYEECLKNHTFKETR